MKTKLNQSKIKLAVASAIVAGSMGLSASSSAETLEGTMTVSTTTNMACIMTVGALTFGTYDPTANEDNSSTATINTTCSNGGFVFIGLGKGNGLNAASTDAVPVREMGSGNEKLGYDLYSDSDRSVVWGNTGPTGKLFTGTGVEQQTVVYGTIPKLQPVSGGLNFIDSVLVTLVY